MTFIIGLLAGIFGGLLGVGGGVVMIPLMVRMAKVSQHTAHGTSLAALVFIGSAGAVTYTLNGAVDVLAAVLLATTAIVTAHFGARFANSLPEWKLKRYFGIFIILMSCLLLLKPHLPRVIISHVGFMKALVLMTTGAATGFLSGMMGVGGGVIMVPVMVLLAGMDQHTAQGSSLLTMVPVGIAGAWTHLRLGNVQTRLLRGLIPGVIAGSYLGGTAANLLPEDDLRIIFCAILIWTGFRYIRASSVNKVSHIEHVSEDV